ncbi:Uncharacterized protein APZ42_001177 [Daphnia magna]|uniref:Uncharacterized protein n=1 Tax=Daphnia magna TaxID=35525 RepID=A0A164J4Q4_9CRUS|nr:Uncharacterized protein APZ42_001177 [Daphnia magna]
MLTHCSYEMWCPIEEETRIDLYCRGGKRIALWPHVPLKMWAQREQQTIEQCLLSD